MKNEGLFYEYQKYAKNIALKFSRYSKRIASVTDDLITEATYGLWRACETFDPERGVKFKSYAKYRIQYALMDFVREKIKLGKRKEKVKQYQINFEAKNNYHEETKANELLEHLFQKLKPKHQEQISKYLRGEKDLKEAGEEAGITETGMSRTISNFRSDAQWLLQCEGEVNEVFERIRNNKRPRGYSHVGRSSPRTRQIA